MRFFFFKTLMFTALLLGIALHANAQSTSMTLVVTTIDGTEHLYQLTEESQLYFEDGLRLVVEDGTGNSETYPLSDIQKMVCTEITATAEIAASELMLLPNPLHDSFIIHNVTEGGLARIYSLDGRLVKTFQASEGVVVDMSAFSQGMYLLHINGQTLKLMKL